MTKKKIIERKPLSKKESIVLNLILEGKRNREIAKEIVSKYDTPTNEKTISTYKGRLMAKLGLTSENNVLLIKEAAIKLGYLPKDSFTLVELKKAISDAIKYGIICADGKPSSCSEEQENLFIEEWLENNV